MQLKFLIPRAEAWEDAAFLRICLPTAGVGTGGTSVCGWVSN